VEILLRLFTHVLLMARSSYGHVSMVQFGRLDAHVVVYCEYHASYAPILFLAMTKDCLRSLIGMAPLGQCLLLHRLRTTPGFDTSRRTTGAEIPVRSPITRRSARRSASFRQPQSPTHELIPPGLCKFA
jgi:hypothetical protein